MVQFEVIESWDLNIFGIFGTTLGADYAPFIVSYTSQSSVANG